jgi:hypothetical protein
MTDAFRGLSLPLSSPTGARIEMLESFATQCAREPSMRVAARTIARGITTRASDRIAALTTMLQRVPNLPPLMLRENGAGSQFVKGPLDTLSSGGDCTAKSTAACAVLRVWLMPATIAFLPQPGNVDHLVCLAWDGRAWLTIDGTHRAP